MIWTSKDIIPDAHSGELWNTHYLYRESATQSLEEYHVGIVGGGPKGLYALDQLLHGIRSKLSDQKLNIYWWNENMDFGSGPNYQIDQPDYLLINYCIGNIDAWDREFADEVGKLNLTDWIRKYNRTECEVKPTDFASRSLVGKYLQSVLAEITKALPSNCELHLIPQKVESVSQETNGHYVVHFFDGTISVDNILLATGHCYSNSPLIKGLSDRLKDRYVNGVYPMHKLENIPAGKRVGVIGWGLTFIDVALHLTEGRGGRFDQTGKYMASGNEPLLIPFSRNNIPILPRSPVYGDQTYRPHYLSKEWKEKFDMISKQRKIDFSKEILPVLQREIEFAYYSTFLKTSNEGEIDYYLKTLKDEERFSIDTLLFPPIYKSGEPKNAMIVYLEYTITEAEKGELESPLMAAAAVWREGSTMIADWYKNGGFTGDSQKELDRRFFGAFCRTTYGPPVANMKKILALIKADIIQIQFDRPVKIIQSENQSAFALATENFQSEVDWILDARIARPNLESGNSLLYQNLMENGLIKPMLNDGYLPGCADVGGTESKQNPKKIKKIYFYGSNTEGFTLDNDSLSRNKNNLAKYWVLDIVECLQSIEKLSK